MTPDQVRQVAQEIFAERLSLHWSAYLFVVCASLIGGAVWSLVSGYFKRCGETWATKADFNTLLAAQKTTTREMEGIKTALANQNWMSQKHWDLKRESYRKC